MKRKILVGFVLVIFCLAGWFGYRVHRGMRFVKGFTADVDQGIAYCTAQIQKNPESPTAWFNRGSFYCNRGILAKMRGLPTAEEDFKHAVADINRAIELEPVFGDSYASSMASYLDRRGDSYFHSGDFERAILDYAKAIQFDPRRGVAYHHRADAFRASGDGCRARQDFRKACDYGLQESCKALKELPPEKASDCPQTPLIQSGLEGVPEEVLSEIEKLATSDPEARVAAARKLGEMGPRAAGAVDLLVSMFFSERRPLQLPGESRPVIPAEVALASIEKMGRPGLQGLLSALSRGHPQTRIRVLGVLGRVHYGPDRELIDSLRHVLEESRDRSLLHRAMEALSKNAGDDPQVRAFLLETLKSDPNPDLREATALTYGYLPALDEPVTQALLQTLRSDQDAAVRRAAASALANGGGDYGVASQALHAAIREDPEEGVRAEAVSALGRRTAIQTGAASLSVRDNRITGLSATLDTPLKSWDGTDQGNQDAIVHALETDKSPVVQRSTALVFGLLGVRSPDAREALRKAASTSEDESVRNYALTALGRMPERDDEIEGLLILRLKEDEAEKVRAAAARALGVRAIDRRRAAEALVSALGGPGHPELEQAVCSTLAILSGGSALRDPEGWRIWWAENQGSFR